jgi:GlpG protein
MRLIGYLPNESSASTFSDYLFVEGIANDVEAEKEGWAVWVHSEDHLAKARELLAAFLGNQGDPKYRRKAAQARDLRTREAEKESDLEESVSDRKDVFRGTMPYGVGALTAVLVGLCLAVQVLRVGGYDEGVLRELAITSLVPDATASPAGQGGKVSAARGLVEIRHGEFWRLFTPVLIHSKDGFWLHLLFNMIWLLDLGSLIEGRQSTGRLGWLVVVIAIGSNLFQYYLDGPAFFGMSGVVYGLLGYVAVKGRLDPASGLVIHPQKVVLMMIWFFLCLLGAVPNVANGAHAAGLILGAALGGLSSLPALLRRN